MVMDGIDFESMIILTIVSNKRLFMHDYIIHVFNTVEFRELK